MAQNQQDLTDAINQLHDLIRNSALNRPGNSQLGSRNFAEFLQMRTGIFDALLKAQEVQSSLLRRNTTVSETISTSLSSAAPKLANLEASLALFDAGLEDNAQGLADFTNRAGILGEDVGKMLVGLRDLRLSLGLTSEEQVGLSKTIMDSAKTYKTSSEGVIDSLNKFSTNLAILNRTQSGKTNDLIVKLSAMTDRVAPGALQDLLGTLVGQGAQSLARVGLLGATGSTERLIQGGASTQDVIDILDQIVKARETFVPAGNLMTIQGNEILKSVVGLNLSQANSAETLRDILTGQLKRDQLTASLDDALMSLNDIMLTFKEPFTEIVMALAKALEFMKNLPFLKDLTRVLAWTSVIVFIGGVLKGIAAIFVVVNAKILAITLILSSIGVILDKIFGSGEETARNTQIVAEEARIAAARRDADLIEAYNRQNTELISAIARYSGRTDAEEYMDRKNAEATRERMLNTFNSSLEVSIKTLEALQRRGSAFGAGGP